MSEEQPPTDTIRLLPCPFCGGTDIVVEPDERGSGGQPVPPFHVGCSACKAEQSHDYEDEAIALWNRRSSAGAPVEPFTCPENRSGDCAASHCPRCRTCTYHCSGHSSGEPYDHPAAESLAVWLESQDKHHGANIVRNLVARLSPEPSGDAEDAQKWRALRHCQRITAMGCAAIVPGTPEYDTPYGHVTLNFWTGGSYLDEYISRVGQDDQDKLGREWLDAFMAKAVKNAAIKAVKS